MICPNCGAEVENGATFCTNCGNSVDSGCQTPVTTDPGAGQGTASLILSIVGLVMNLVCSWCYGSGTLIGLVCSIIGLITGINALKASAAAGFTNGKAKTGKILSIVNLVLTAVLAVLGVVFLIIYFIAIVGISASGY